MMDYKKVKTENNAITRNVSDFTARTGNLYETVVILSKRANQIALEIKEELGGKIEEFSSHQDNLEEVFENREQIEIARFYERLPKPTLIAIHEYLNDQLYIRDPQVEEEEDKNLVNL
jgi:DNA-directed RNA polymerase subunit K/omega